MRVFWAWQSDHPRRISKNFILAALEAAIDEIKAAREIAEAPEESRKSELEVDHDTKGLTGSPDIAASILDKIAAAKVFVGDITPVGSTPVIKGNEGDLPTRKLVNPNVAIEYGYAMGKLGDAAVIGVMNLAYGKREELPFDIVHKRWPITYRLEAEATKAEIEHELPKLTAKLVEALKGYIDNPQPANATFKQTPWVGAVPFFAKRTEVLGTSRQMGGDLKMPYESVLYLRVIPTKRLVRPMAQRVMMESVYKYGAAGSNDLTLNPLPNEYGVAMVSPVGTTRDVDAITQYFANGEVWIINADVIRGGDRLDDKWYSVLEAERVFAETLNFGLDYMKNVAQAELPYKVIGGVHKVKGRRMVRSGAALNVHGHFMEDGVEVELVLHENTREAEDAFLGELYESIFDLTGYPRPQGLNGFFTKRIHPR